MREKPLILVVDDEKNFREIMLVKLRSVGFEVAVAKNQKEAIKMATDSLPDLILMDIHIGGEDGTDAAFALKENPKTKDIPVAFLTSMKEPWPAMAGNHEKVANELGMQGFIEKGSDLDSIVAKVRELLGQGMPAAPPVAEVSIEAPAAEPVAQEPAPPAEPHS